MYCPNNSIFSKGGSRSTTMGGGGITWNLYWKTCFGIEFVEVLVTTDIKKLIIFTQRRIQDTNYGGLSDNFESEAEAIILVAWNMLMTQLRIIDRWIFSFSSRGGSRSPVLGRTITIIHKWMTIQGFCNPRKAIQPWYLLLCYLYYYAMLCYYAMLFVYYCYVLLTEGIPKLMSYRANNCLPFSVPGRAPDNIYVMYTIAKMHLAVRCARKSL